MKASELVELTVKFSGFTLLPKKKLAQQEAVGGLFDFPVKASAMVKNYLSFDFHTAQPFKTKNIRQLNDLMLQNGLDKKRFTITKPDNESTGVMVGGVLGGLVGAAIVGAVEGARNAVNGKPQTEPTFTLSMNFKKDDDEDIIRAKYYEVLRVLKTSLDQMGVTPPMMYAQH